MADPKKRPEVEFKGTPFKEAIDFFQGKVRVPTRAYTDLMGAAGRRKTSFSRIFRKPLDAASGTA